MEARDISHPLRSCRGLLRIEVLNEQSSCLGFVAEWGEPGDNALVRVHSRCSYAEVLGSLECDCGPQLALAQDLIAEEGVGMLFYLEQEGRGAGLDNKARGYRLTEEQGIDTFTAYDKLGLDRDSRSYRSVGMFLRDRGISAIRLLTNNPAKIAELEQYGLDVERIALTPAAPAEAESYLLAKRRAGHLL